MAVYKQLPHPIRVLSNYEHREDAENATWMFHNVDNPDANLDDEAGETVRPAHPGLDKNNKEEGPNRPRTLRFVRTFAQFQRLQEESFPHTTQRRYKKKEQVEVVRKIDKDEMAAYDDDEVADIEVAAKDDDDIVHDDVGLVDDDEEPQYYEEEESEESVAPGDYVDDEERYSSKFPKPFVKSGKYPRSS